VRARVLAPLLAAVLGIAGGVTTALATHSADPGLDPASGDPLHLGIPLIQQGCTGESITVLGYGDNAAALTPAVANADQGSARYLESARSCDTLYGSTKDPHPTYVVYAGPYDAPAEPCATRMEGADNRGSVTRLRSGNQDFVKCSCVLKKTVGPQLRVGMDADARDVTWIRLLQVMLHDATPQAFPGTEVTGRYDQATADQVAAYQARSPGKLTTPGVVDATTWGILNDRLCPNYSW
jgi:hypothetical protein